MARRTLVSLFFVALVLLSLPEVVSAASGRTAVLTDLKVNEQVNGDVVVFVADVDIGAHARIDGDVVAVGGEIRVAEGAEISRHVVAVLGGADVAQGARIGGRVLSYSSLASLVPNSVGHRADTNLNFSMHLLTAGGWLLVTTGLGFGFPTRMRYGAWSLPTLGFKVPALGIMVSLTVVASLIAALGLGPALGVPLVAGLMIVFFVAKSVGLTVLGGWLGSVVLRRWIHHPLPISLEVFVGVLVLLALRFLPIAGETLWILISLVALGASVAVLGVSTDLGRAQHSIAGR